MDEKLLHDEYEKEKGKFILPDDFVVEDVFFLQGKDQEASTGKSRTDTENDHEER